MGYNGSRRLYTHIQQICINITGLAQPRFSRLAVGAASGVAGTLPVVFIIIACLVYWKKKRLACFGQYSKIGPFDEMDIVGFVELDVGNAWDMPEREVCTYVRTYRSLCTYQASMYVHACDKCTYKEKFCLSTTALSAKPFNLPQFPSTVPIL